MKEQVILNETVFADVCCAMKEDPFHNYQYRKHNLTNQTSRWAAKVAKCCQLWFFEFKMMRACGSKCVATNRFTAALVAVEFQQWKRNVSTSSISAVLAACHWHLNFLGDTRMNMNELYMHTYNDASVKPQLKPYQDTRKHTILRSSIFCSRYCGCFC